MKKYFTLDEANNLIPLLEFKLPKLLRIKNDMGHFLKTLAKKGVNVEELFGMTDLQDEDLIRIKGELEKYGTALTAALTEIQNLGCIIKDMEMGLVDFYGIIDDTEILFCWQLGEPCIGYWHKTSEGFQNRKPLFEETEKQLH